MDKKRIGNDVIAFWTVFYPGGTPVDFSVATDIVLEVHHQGRNREYACEFKSEENTVEIQFPAGKQVHTGSYTAWLQWKIADETIEGGVGTHTMDWENAFELVEKTSQLKELNSDPIYLKGFVSYGLTKKDKEILVRMMLSQPELNTIKGDPFTYDDFTEEQIANLQKPATDAASLAGIASVAADEAKENANQAAVFAALSANSANDAAQRVESLLRYIGDIPDVFGYRYLTGQADDRVEPVNDLPYDGTGIAPAGSKRKRLLDKIRPYQCNHDGSQREYLQDDVRLTVGYTPSRLTDPMKLQMARVPHLFYRSFELGEYTYVLFCETAPEEMGEFIDPAQWKEITPSGYPRYRGIRKQIDGVQKLLSFSGEYPTVSVSLINFQVAAKNTNPDATVTPYYLYEAIVFLMTLELGRHNAQAYYQGVTNASTSYADAAVTGVTDTLTTPSGEVEVEWQEGSFTKQFRWRFIECVYGQIWNVLSGIYYVYDAENDVNRVYITRDPAKINTNSDISEYIYVGDTPAVNGYIKKCLPGMIEAAELGGSTTTYMADYHYTSNSATTRIALSGGSSGSGGNAGPRSLLSTASASSPDVRIGAALVMPG